MSLTPAFSCAATAVSGSAAWYVYFHRVETYMHGLLYLNTFVLSCTAGLVAWNKVANAAACYHNGRSRIRQLSYQRMW